MQIADVLKPYGLVYLATVYSKHPSGIHMAFVEASSLAASLMRAGVKVYSPIAHAHPIATYGNGDAYDHEVWLPFDEAIMGRSDAIAVAMMDKWSVSRGIAHEIAFFRKADKPVHYFDPRELMEATWPAFSST